MVKRLLTTAAFLLILTTCVSGEWFSPYYSYYINGSTTGYNISWNGIRGNLGENVTYGLDGYVQAVSFGACNTYTGCNRSVLLTAHTEKLTLAPAVSALHINLGCAGAGGPIINYSLNLYSSTAYDNNTVTWANYFGANVKASNCVSKGALLQRLTYAGIYDQSNKLFWNSTTLQTYILTQWALDSPSYFCLEIELYPGSTSAIYDFYQPSCEIYVGGPTPANINLNYLGYNTSTPNATSCLFDDDCAGGGILTFCNQVTGYCEENNVALGVVNGSNTAINATFVNASWTAAPTATVYNLTASISASMVGEVVINRTANLTAIDADPVLGAENFYQVDAFIGAAKVGQSNITGLNVSECSFNDECPTGFSCRNYTCSLGVDECFTDGDCLTSEYCSTWTTTYSFCDGLVPDGGSCVRNHECLNDNCTAHVNNSAFGDYPLFRDYGYYPYPYSGWCVGNDTVGCSVDGDCNASEFCRIVSYATTPPGVCEGLRGVGDYCGGSNWCAVGLLCVNNLCVNVSVNGTDQCSLNNTAGSSYDRIFPDCIGQSGCGTYGEACYCGQTTYNGTYLCLLRSNLTQTCAALVGGGENEDRCLVGLQCMDLVCRPNAWMCAVNYQCPTGGPIHTLDSYCPADKYCDTTLSIPQCFTRLNFNSACSTTIGDYQCGSCNCNPLTSRCAASVLSPFTHIDVTLNGNVTAFVFPPDATVNIHAEYEDDNNNPISGASCAFYADGANPANGTLDYYLGGFYSADFITTNAVGTHTLLVQCQHPDYYSASTTLSFVTNTSMSGPQSTRVRWMITPASSVTTGEYVTWDVIYEAFNFTTGSYAHIPAASCGLSLYKAGAFQVGTGFVEVDASYHTELRMIYGAGLYSARVVCSKPGYSGANISASFFVYQDTCENGIIDPGEAGVDCGGPCPPCSAPPSHCSDGIKNYDETGVDCGGASCGSCPVDGACVVDSDCESGWCHSGTCDSPSCFDGIRNGREDGVDCGGPCADTCWCNVNNDCLPNDGSVTCSCGNYPTSCVGYCATSTCTTDADCPDVLWRQGGYFDYVGRVCDTQTHRCSFGVRTPDNSSIRQNASITVRPMSGIIVNVSGTQLYLSNCEDADNGYTVTTDALTTKHYLFGTSPYSPAFGATTTYSPFGGTEKTLAVSALVPEYCQIPPAYDRVYTRTVFYGCTDDACRSRQVDSLTFRERFRVNVSSLNASVLSFDLNRAGNCYYSALSSSAMTLFGSGNTSYLLDRTAVNASFSLNWYCNTTYGESRHGFFNGSIFGILWFGFSSFFGALLGLMFPGLTVKPWMWTLFILFVFIGVPLVILVIFEARRRAAESSNTTLLMDRRGGGRGRR